MPYKDPKRKRQWECEHREERNARRRKFSSSHSSEPSGISDTHSDSNSSSMSVARGIMMGLAFLLTVLFLMRRLGSSPILLQAPDPE
jgi:hypothetical protein